MAADEQDGCRSRIVKSFTSNNDDDPRALSATTMTDVANDDNPSLIPRDDESSQRLPPTPPSPEEFEGSGEKTPYRTSGTLSTLHNTRFLQTLRARERREREVSQEPATPKVCLPIVER